MSHSFCFYGLESGAQKVPETQFNEGDGGDEEDPFGSDLLLC